MSGIPEASSYGPHRARRASTRTTHALVRQERGEPIARGAGEMTLFVPHGVHGFVCKDDGSVSLKSILVPIAHRPRPQPAVEAAARLMRNLKLPPGVVTLLNVGAAEDMPAIRLPEHTNWKWGAHCGCGRPGSDDPQDGFGCIRRPHSHDDRRAARISRCVARKHVRAGVARDTMPCREPSRRLTPRLKSSGTCRDHAKSAMINCRWESSEGSQQ